MNNVEIVKYLAECGISAQVENAFGQYVKMDDGVFCDAADFKMLNYYYIKGERVSGESLAYDGDAYFNARVFVKGIGEV